MENLPTPDKTYTMIKVGEGTGGGLMKNPMPNAPSSWLAYVLVDNLEKAVGKAKALGGTIMKDKTDVKDMGSFAIIEDPTGAMLGLWDRRKNARAGLSCSSICRNPDAKIGVRSAFARVCRTAAAFQGGLAVVFLALMRNCCRKSALRPFFSGVAHRFLDDLRDILHLILRQHFDRVPGIAVEPEAFSDHGRSRAGFDNAKLRFCHG